MDEQEAMPMAHIALQHQQMQAEQIRSALFWQDRMREVQAVETDGTVQFINLYSSAPNDIALTLM